MIFTGQPCGHSVPFYPMTFTQHKMKIHYITKNNNGKSTHIYAQLYIKRNNKLTKCKYPGFTKNSIAINKVIIIIVFELTVLELGLAKRDMEFSFEKFLGESKNRVCKLGATTGSFLSLYFILLFFNFIVQFL